MALSSIGIKTYKWNNYIKSILFLALYPLVITSTYISLAIFFALYLIDNYNADFFSIIKMVVWHYWYVPYAFAFSVLFLSFLREHNSVNFFPDTHAASDDPYPAILKRMDNLVIDKETYDDVLTSLDNLCISRGLHKPYLLIQDHPSLNAYSLGVSRKTYRITITTGLLKSLSAEEIENVLAHELSHIMNGDTQLLFFTTTISNCLRTLATLFDPKNHFKSPFGGYVDDDMDMQHRRQLMILPIFLMLKLSSLGAWIAQMFVSTKRDYIADIGAIEMIKTPEVLIQVLEKVKKSPPYIDDNVRPYLFHCDYKSIVPTHIPLRKRIEAIARYSKIEIPSSVYTWVK